MPHGMLRRRSPRTHLCLLSQFDEEVLLQQMYDQPVERLMSRELAAQTPHSGRPTGPLLSQGIPLDCCREALKSARSKFSLRSWSAQ